MNRPASLRRRLLWTWAGAILAALVVAWAGLTLLFERHVERRYSEQLGIHAQSLAARLVAGPDGRLTLSRPLSEPRFDSPLSGLYWTVAGADGVAALRSRSVWDRDLPAAAPPAGGAVQVRRSDDLLLVERRVRLAAGDRPAVIQVAMDADEIAQARAQFARELALSLALLGLALAVAAWAQVELGLKPLERLRAATGEVEADPTARLAGDFPKEVLPLVGALNRLLEARAASIEAAQRRAADLAHGLKSPLSVLRNEAARQDAAGRGDAALAMREAIAAMDRQVDRELSRARAALAAERGPASCAAREVADQIVRVVARTADGERLAWTNAVAEDQTVPLEQSDLAEALGPLVENAARHARSAVRIVSEGAGIAVEDDGPGLDAAQRERALRRGVRIDERGGAGLGLSIAAEVLDAYGWRLALGDSALGGLKATIAPDMP